jgi:hypothetical protein
MKKKRGRKKGDGVLSGINPERETWDDIRNRIAYDSAEWPLVKVRTLIGDGSVLPDNYLTVELAKYDAKVAAHVCERTEIFRKHRRSPKECWRRLADMRNKLPLMPPILSAWRTLLARFERAVLDGNAEWFDAQAKPLRSAEHQEHIRFNEEVLYWLKMKMWETQANRIRYSRRKFAGRHIARGFPMKWRHLTDDEWNVISHPTFPKRSSVSRANRLRPRFDDATLAPAGKFTDKMASDIFKALRRQEVDGVLFVEGTQFENEARVREAIHDLASQLQFALKKQPHGKHRKH